MHGWGNTSRNANWSKLYCFLCQNVTFWDVAQTCVMAGNISRCNYIMQWGLSLFASFCSFFHFGLVDYTLAMEFYITLPTGCITVTLCRVIVWPGAMLLHITWWFVNYSYGFGVCLPGTYFYVGMVSVPVGIFRYIWRCMCIGQCCFLFCFVLFCSVLFS